MKKKLLRRDIFKRDYLLFFVHIAVALSTLITTPPPPTTTKYAYIIIIEVYNVQ